VIVEVGVRELRARLSARLDRVQAGDEIVVTERGKPVTRLMPARSKLQELIERYFDSSALLRELLRETGWERAAELWNDALLAASSRTAYVEVRAAIAAAARGARLPPARAEEARGTFDERWQAVLVVELDEPLALQAAEAADRYGLRAADAIQLASALVLEDLELVFATWDDRLRAAAADADLAVAP
jgi:prevent-host-death family protein